MIRTTALALSLLTLGTAWAADSLGAAGTVDVLDVNSVHADTYLQFHGRVYVNAGGAVTEYRWGGSSCSNRTLTEGQVAALQRASEAGALVTPRFLPGQGLNRCLVGFTVRSRY